MDASQRVGVYSHTGAVYGHTSCAFFDPKHDSAAVILSNRRSAITGVLCQRVRAELAGDSAVSMETTAIPATGGALNLVRVIAAYWITMFAAGAFIFCCVLAIQGLAAQLLPRRHFLQISSFLQIAAFCVIVAVYFLEPKLAAPGDSQPYLGLVSRPTGFLGCINSSAAHPRSLPSRGGHGWASR